LDCTDWCGPFHSEKEALIYVCEFYEVDDNGNDYESPDYDDTFLTDNRTDGRLT
jgi:hypothetical protein